MRALFIMMCMLMTFSCNNPKIKTNIKEKEAVKIAVKPICKKYPLASSDPHDWDAYFEEGIWYVFPTIKDGYVGGGPTAEVDDETGKVMRVYFEGENRNTQP